jgi:hypothetical protein
LLMVEPEAADLEGDECRGSELGTGNLPGGRRRRPRAQKVAEEDCEEREGRRDMRAYMRQTDT